MITRIVKLTIKDSKIAEFRKFANIERQKVKSFDGCHNLDFFNDTKFRNVFFTISYWNSEEHLNNYRESDFFKHTWNQIKGWFACRAEVWTTEQF